MSDFDMVGHRQVAFFCLVDSRRRSLALKNAIILIY